MFLHLSVSHSVHGGVSLRALGQTPLGQIYPSMHWGRPPQPVEAATAAVRIPLE